MRTTRPGKRERERDGKLKSRIKAKVDVMRKQMKEERAVKQPGALLC